MCGLLGAGHYSFTDICSVFGPDFDGCGTEYRDPALVAATLRTVVLAFLMSVQGERRDEDCLPPSEGISHWEAGE